MFVLALSIKPWLRYNLKYNINICKKIYHITLLVLSWRIHCPVGIHRKKPLQILRSSLSSGLLLTLVRCIFFDLFWKPLFTLTLLYDVFTAHFPPISVFIPILQTHPAQKKMCLTVFRLTRPSITLLEWTILSLAATQRAHKVETTVIISSSTVSRQLGYNNLNRERSA